MEAKAMHAQLLSYVEAYLEQGHVFLFKFSLALVAALNDEPAAPGTTDGASCAAPLSR